MKQKFLRAQQVLKAMQELADPIRAKHALRFFKTGPGEYGEGDSFIGISVPKVRALEKEFFDLDLKETSKLLRSKIHEVRLFALIHLSNLYTKSKANPSVRDEIYELYMSHTDYINNWDLVDTSAHKIVGPHLQDEPNFTTLRKLAQSKNMWERRIAMVSCWYYNTKSSQYHITYELATLLINDSHDLMHKAVGWMLREMGKKDHELLIEFLDEHAKTMPRTALRYSLEKVSEEEKHYYMNLYKSN